MSRSHKKNPILTDGRKRKGQVEIKRIANKRVRNYDKELPNGKAYRKLFPSWDIHDWISRYTVKDAEELYKDSTYLQKKYPTFKEYYDKYYKKYYYRK